MASRPFEAICQGVSKSGSPTLKEMTSSSFEASLKKASNKDGLTLFRLLETEGFIVYQLGLNYESLVLMVFFDDDAVVFIFLQDEVRRGGLDERQGGELLRDKPGDFL